MSEIAKGTKVRFKVGRSQSAYVAEVVNKEGQFLVTKDADGKVRKVRPGSCEVVG